MLYHVLGTFTWNSYFLEMLQVVVLKRIKVDGTGGFQSVIALQKQTKGERKKKKKKKKGCYLNLVQGI